jgi:thiamine-monophosphate kinase
MKTLREVGEDGLIGRLVRLVPCGAGGEGPGDDCAVVDLGDGRVQLLKADALVEGVHYLRGEAGRPVGWKAAARVVSDFAAMGGRPERFLITLALDGATAVAWVEEVYRGIGDCLARYGGVVAGGETCSVPAGSAAVIAIAATGAAGRGEVVTRSGGRPGDRVLVSGRLGGSLRGKHLSFEPRAAEGVWLARRFLPTAMMDVSDGLAKDLPRLAAASGCGYWVDEEKLPLNAGCSVAEGLGDGEDFELLLTVEKDRVGDLLAEWGKEFPDLELTEIGCLTAAGEGMDWSGGWDHFR